MLVHGSMDRSTSFAKVARHLNGADDGADVRRYDRRGYGTATEAGVTGIDGHVDDLLAVIGDGPAVVAGHSIGGVIALMAAERAPDRVRAVVAYEAPMPWEPWYRSAGSQALAGATDPADVAERFMRRMIGDHRWSRLPPSTKVARRAEGAALVADLRSLRGDDPPYDAIRIAVPVVAGRGERSLPHHRRAAAELAAAAPLGELVDLPGADHGVHLSYPGAFADLVRRVIART